MLLGTHYEYYASMVRSIPTLATVMLNLSKAGVTGNPSSRSRSPCRKNSSHALCDHSRDTLHGLHNKIIQLGLFSTSPAPAVSFLSGSAGTFFRYITHLRYQPAWIRYVCALQRDLKHEPPKSRFAQVEPGVLVCRVQVLPQLAKVLRLPRYVRR